MLRAIHEIRPGWIVGENVGGILTMVQPGKAAHVGCQPSLFGEDQPVYRKREEYVVETICRDLEREGYTVQPLLIPACAVGAPHRRDRVWFVAHADGEGLQPEGTELSPEGASGNHPRDATAHPDSGGDTPLATVERWKRQGRVSMHETEDGEKNPNGLTDFLDFHGLLPTPTARDWKARRPWKISKGRGRTRIRQPSRFLCPGWEEFPTQSPVCGRDDGVPRQLDGITFSSWRQQSVKGYGNAIVPQVIHEIFKAIESTYK